MAALRLPTLADRAGRRRLVDHSLSFGESLGGGLISRGCHDCGFRQRTTALEDGFDHLDARGRERVALVFPKDEIATVEHVLADVEADAD